jgi:FkbM family methyltransferase
MSAVVKLQLAKACFSFRHPTCWRALSRGVAPSVEHRAILSEVDCDLFLDVGANRGQFSLMARLLHSKVAIHAYEPLPTEASVYRWLHESDSNTTLHEVALGAEEGSAALHVSARPDSSSLLQIGDLQVELFPGTKEIGTHVVQVASLDTFVSHWCNATRGFLKLDVQGFELSVLQGAAQALAHCAYVYAECSHMQLYRNQPLFPEVAAFLASRGFQFHKRVNEHWMDGHLVQADNLFTRRRS